MKKLQGVLVDVSDVINRTGHLELVAGKKVIDVLMSKIIEEQVRSMIALKEISHAISQMNNSISFVNFFSSICEVKISYVKLTFTCESSISCVKCMFRKISHVN